MDGGGVKLKRKGGKRDGKGPREDLGLVPVAWRASPSEDELPPCGKAER